MDPYELFSTPPSEMMLSSTPSKQPAKKKTSKAPNSGRKAFSAVKAAKEPSKILQNRSKTTDNCYTPSNKNTRGKGRRKKKQTQDNNLWDKYLKTNPELAQFVDDFNQSLEEACSKPLDMSDDK